MDAILSSVADAARPSAKEARDVAVVALLKLELSKAQETIGEQRNRLADLETQVVTLEAALAAAQSRAAGQAAQLDAAVHDAERRQAQLLREAEVHQVKAGRLAETNAKLSAKLEALQADFARHRGESEKRERELHQRVVALQRELDHTKVTAQRASQAATAQDMEAFQKVASLSAELDSQKLRLKTAQESHERAAKAAAQEIATLKGRVQEGEARYERLHAEHAAAQRAALDKALALAAEAQAVRDERDAVLAQADLRGKGAFEQITRLNCEIDSLQRQVVQLTGLNDRRVAEHAEAVGALTVECAALLDRLEQQQTGAARSEAAGAAQGKALMAQLEVLQAQQREAAAAAAQRLLQERLTAQKTEADLAEARAQVANQQQEALRREQEAWDQGIAFKAEITSLKNEIERHKATIQQLEGFGAEIAELRALVRENDLLKSDVEGSHNKVRRLTATMSAMSDTIRTLTDQNLRQAQRLQEVELQMSVPSASSAAPRSTRSDVSQADAALRPPSGASRKSTASFSPATASAMGRHRVEPLPPSPGAPAAPHH